jgi:trehalose-6-phosphatase
LTLALNVGGITATAGEAYADVAADAWFANTVATAKSLGLIDANMTADGNFYPDKNINRQEMLVMLRNLAKHMNKDLSVKGGKVVTDFNDYGQIEKWAVDAANWAYSHGLVSGRDGNLLAPKATATRAEVSQIFMKYLQNIK